MAGHEIESKAGVCKEKERERERKKKKKKRREKKKRENLLSAP